MITVSVEQGILKGAKCSTDKGNEYFEFLCVPYAKPPVGDLRFKSPQNAGSWDGIRDATTVNENQIACQMDLFQNVFVGSEDCLYLNIFTPKLPNDDENTELLPVMFHIHGGGFLYKDGIIKSETGPDYLIDNNVVVVSINYRLGIFGFLSLDIPEAAGNMGLKDQVHALIWVQNNINKFGGDKSNVTIFGISAGGASVEYLMLSPKSEGLFHKAIQQSGSSLNHWAINFEPQQLLHKVIQQLGFQGSPQDRHALYEYLMACPPDVLVKESSKIIEDSAPERLFFGFVPTIEKDFGNGDAFLTNNPYKLLKEGKFNKVPVIKGFCEMEGYFMDHVKPSGMKKLNTNKNFLKHWAYLMETNDFDIFNERFAKVYNKNIKDLNEEHGDRYIIDFFGDYDFISGIWLSGQIMSEHGINVYLYKFSYDGKINFFKNAVNISKKGASHADDASYIFKMDSVSNLADRCDINVRENVTRLWTNFARTSNPVRPREVPIWPLFTRKSQEYLNIGEKLVIELCHDTEKMDIFEEIYNKYQM